VVECAGLENQSPCKRTAGSNPAPSANPLPPARLLPSRTPPPPTAAHPPQTCKYRRIMMRRLVLVGALCCALGPASAASAVTFHSGHGLTITRVKQLNPRLYAIVVRTRTLPDPANIYVLLPPGYSSRSARRYPVFYLLHGTSGTASDWTLKGHAQRVIGNRPLITVMPDIALNDGGGGWCTNWPNGAQRWETFHIHQLLPWVQSNLRTLNTRGERAIAGLSQGGFCSMSYAARHPDLFSIALGYSGAPDIYYDPQARAGAEAVINATEVGLDHVPPNTFFGNPLTDGINWAAHDPATLAENLRWTRMYMYWGNGQNGPYDSPGSSGGANAIEALIWGDNNYFQTRLNSLGIPAYFDDYGNGTHSWPYWTRDLRWSIGRIMFDFEHPTPAPSQFTFTSADNAYSIYGWRVTMHRAAREFSTLSQAGRGGFDLSGSGSASVLTAADYRPNMAYQVSMYGDGARPQTTLIRGRRDGRLLLNVRLGPANPYRQDTAQAQAHGTAVFTTTVTISQFVHSRPSMP
jgi:S-formylglutathione hydrolase FrmB